ncbi:hypothetical protein HMPREF9554_03162 [Treponema phagedenis F0421]|nr:hypothetical protein HMPREF9554_03162 [Treponema phagedenis F0421]
MPWTAVVPRSSDVLKAQPLSSAFKTRRLNFDKDVKIKSWYQKTLYCGKFWHTV